MDSSKRENQNEESTEQMVNPGYALGQLAKAYTTNQTHEDPKTCLRAANKVEKWLSVLHGMFSGLYKIGSRTPITGIPAWITLEVVHGGFASGAFSAGGDILPHEKDLLEKLNITTTGTERTIINNYYFSQQGFRELRQILLEGSYRIQVPEEGALLVVAWLLENEQPNEAKAIIDEIGPYLSTLRFYPIPGGNVKTNTSFHLQDISETVHKLQAIGCSKRIETEREAIQIWTPIYDNVVSLFIETVENDWPCQHYPCDWQSRAQTTLEEYHNARLNHKYCGKPKNKSQNFSILRDYLSQCIIDPRKLTGSDVGRIRSILTAIDAKRGLPGSSRCQFLRESQAKQVKKMTNTQLAQILMSRLMQFPQDDGLQSLDMVMAPLSSGEAEQLNLEQDQMLPERLLGKLQPCIDAPLDKLVEIGVITSGETLAKLVPRLTSQVRAAGITDVSLQRLYTAIYEAFRQRRSLLLFNLESQVKINELPWIKAIESHRKDDQNTRTQALRILNQVVVLFIKAFPHQIMPNKLLQEIRTITDSAGLQLPIVDELAADIFMGDFSEKYVRAAQMAGRLLKGTLYERYFNIPYDSIKQIDDIIPSRFKTPTSEKFAHLCREMAGETDTQLGWSVARNGKIIEQQQIVTTHNLAVLFNALDLTTTLGSDLSTLAGNCYKWICRKQQMKITDYHTKLRMLKNTAYAWRQMVFYLSLLSNNDIQNFLVWANSHLQKQQVEYQNRFQPVLNNLNIVVRSLIEPQQADVEPVEELQPFLGWTTEKHWLMP